MSLLEALKDQEKALEEAMAKEAEGGEEQPVEEKPAEEAKPEAKEEKAEDKPAEEAKTEEAKPVEERVKSPAEIRLDKKKREQVLADTVAVRDAELARANAMIAELQKGKSQGEDKDPEPSKEEDPTAHLAWENRQIRQELAEVKKETKAIKQEKATENLKSEALSEIEGYEAQVRSKHPDYNEAKSYFATMLATAARMQNPDLTDAQLSKVVEQQLFNRAAKYQRDGYENPIEPMYEEAKKWGFKPQKTTEVEEKTLKPDPKRVAANRERNAGTAGASGGSGQGEITLNYLAKEMTVAEIAKLPKGQIERILKQQSA